MMDQLIKLIKQHDVIAIFRHILPDCDALGAQFALALWIRNNFADKKVYIIGDIDDERLSNYFTAEVEPDLSALNNALGIAVDTPILDRIDFNQHFLACETTVIIDHHPVIKKFANFHWGGVSYSATCEYLGWLFFEINQKDPNIKLNSTICEYLFCGLVADTNRFFYANVQPATFDIASKLLNQNIDMQRVYRLLYFRSLAKTRLSAYVMQNFFLTKYNVAHFFLKPEIWKQFNVPYLEAKDLVYVMQNIDNVDYCVYGSLDPTKKVYRFSLRSNKKPINQIARSFNGGGHALACGVKSDKFETYHQLVKEIDNFASLDYE